jgi:glutathione S-transferase
MARLGAAKARGTNDADAEQAVTRCLGRLELALDGRDYLLGELTLADCPWVALAWAEVVGMSLQPPLTAYVERLKQRPAWRRAEQRLERCAMGAG